MSEDEKNVSESYCIHSMRATRANKEIFYCIKCGIFQNEMVGIFFYLNSSNFQSNQRDTTISVKLILSSRSNTL